MYLIFLTLPLFCLADFQELLSLRPLENQQKVLAYFQFVITWDVPRNFNSRNADYGPLFPKPLGQIISFYGLHEFHLALTAGHWLYSSWGSPPFPSPSGAEIYAWFDHNHTSISQWNGFLEALSGLICASLNTINHHHNFISNGTFQPLSNHCLLDDHKDQPICDFFYGTLSREAVCTENLTPWLKLLPCRNKSGLASLFDPLKIFETDFQSLQTHFISNSTNNGNQWILIQSLSFVYRLPSNIDLNKNPIRNILSLLSSSTFSLNKSTQSNINISSIDPIENVNGINPQCPLASFSKILFYKDNHRSNTITTPLIIHRYVTGSGLYNAGIVTEIYHNNISNFHSTNYPLFYHFSETYPWFIRIFFHTVNIEMKCSTPFNSTLELIDSEFDIVGPDKPLEILDNDISRVKSYFTPLHLHSYTNKNKTIFRPVFSFLPALDRLAPSYLDLHFHLPSHCVLIFSFDFIKGFPVHDDFPPDVSRGFDIQSGILTVDLPTHELTSKSNSSNLMECIDIHSNLCVPIRSYSEPLLIRLPYPDASMPFNVIAFSSSALAFFFGSMFSILYKSRMELISSKSGFRRIIEKISYLYRAKFLRRNKIKSQ